MVFSYVPETGWQYLLLLNQKKSTFLNVNYYLFENYLSNGSIRLIYFKILYFLYISKFVPFLLTEPGHYQNTIRHQDFKKRAKGLIVSGPSYAIFATHMMVEC